ncbi:hypothetical protein SUNI508_11713 [Seiridium unicorne]|uniref:Uncharacterized protein n=1 Tax=Seiridium unicorne TaxID=138068 RepID=A0ABR2UGM6_9PEZI
MTSLPEYSKTIGQREYKKKEEINKSKKSVKEDNDRGDSAEQKASSSMVNHLTGDPVTNESHGVSSPANGARIWHDDGHQAQSTDKTNGPPQVGDFAGIGAQFADLEANGTSVDWSQVE